MSTQLEEAPADNAPAGEALATDAAVAQVAPAVVGVAIDTIQPVVGIPVGTVVNNNAAGNNEWMDNLADQLTEMGINDHGMGVDGQHTFRSTYRAGGAIRGEGWIANDLYKSRNGIVRDSYVTVVALRPKSATTAAACTGARTAHAVVASAPS